MCLLLGRCQVKTGGSICTAVENEAEQHSSVSFQDIWTNMKNIWKVLMGRDFFFHVKVLLIHRKFLFLSKRQATSFLQKKNLENSKITLFLF